MQTCAAGGAVRQSRRDSARGGYRAIESDWMRTFTHDCGVVVGFAVDGGLVSIAFKDRTLEFGERMWAWRVLSALA